jgi:hypothetical protein
MNKTRLTLLASLSLLSATPGPTPQSPSELPAISRTQMLATARSMAEHEWTAGPSNLVASCLPSDAYESDWTAGQTVTGIPYDWGGMDGPEAFDAKLAAGQAAGSHSRHGVSSCTAGVDCSGFISLVWGSTRKFGTSNIDEIALHPRYDWFTQMQPGDALNKAGSHIVLFVGYRPDGNPIAYEASGSRNRVILNDWSPWSRYVDYVPIQYRNVVD